MAEPLPTLNPACSTSRLFLTNRSTPVFHYGFSLTTGSVFYNQARSAYRLVYSLYNPGELSSQGRVPIRSRPESESSITRGDSINLVYKSLKSAFAFEERLYQADRPGFLQNHFQNGLRWNWSHYRFLGEDNQRPPSNKGGSKNFILHVHLLKGCTESILLQPWHPYLPQGVTSRSSSHVQAPGYIYYLFKPAGSNRSKKSAFLLHFEKL